MASPRDDGARERTLARKWAYLLAQATYVPMPHADIERELRGLLDDLVAAATDGTAAARAAHAGSRLVALNCTGEGPLRATMDVLGRGLAELPALRRLDRPAERVGAALAGLAAGFLDAARRDIFDQQERTKLALLKAFRDAKGNLAESEARFEKVTTCSPSGIAVTDLDGRFQSINSAFSTILGYTDADLAHHTLFDIAHPDRAAHLREEYQSLLESDTERVKQNLRMLRKDGDTAWVTLTASVLPGDGTRAGQFVTVVEDGTEVVLLQSELSRQALHDVLTGLPNRQFFTTQVETALRQADQRHGVTLYRIDLDAFTVIRGGLGHEVAEQVLCQVARRLQTLFTDTRATVARLGTDEFAVLVTNTADSPEPVVTVTEIAETLGETYYVDDESAGLSVSIGIVHRPSERDPVALLDSADLALRRARDNGLGQWEFWHPDTAEADRRRFALAAALSSAWENGEVEVDYRPVARSTDGRVVAVEALLRWEHPEEGRLSHERCVELAEETGLVLSLGQWLLTRGCGQVQWWSRQLGRELSLVVGLDALQARDADLVSRVVRALDETSLPAGRVEVGFPASTLVGTRGAARDNLRVLAERGVRTAVRDFGVTAGEIAAVEDLPVDTAWLAPSLVRRRADSGPSPVLTALTDLSTAVRAQGVTVVVDGVDTEEQAAWWRSAGAELTAGTLVGRPDTPGRITTLLGRS